MADDCNSSLWATAGRTCTVWEAISLLILCISHTFVTFVSNSDLFTLKRTVMGATEQSPRKRSKNNSRGGKQMLWRQLKKLWSFHLKERMRSDLITLSSTHLKWFGIESGGWPALHAQRETNKRKFYLNQISKILWSEMGKRISSSSRFTFERRPWISIPGILQKDMKELCLHLPAKNLEMSFTVVSLWCYKSGITSAAWRQNWIYEPLDLDRIMDWENLAILLWK